MRPPGLGHAVARVRRGHGRGRRGRRPGRLRARPAWLRLCGPRGFLVIGAAAALALGGAIGYLAGRSVVGTALRQLAVAAVAAAVTYTVGSLLGVATT